MSSSNSSPITFSVLGCAQDRDIIPVNDLRDVIDTARDLVNCL